MAEKTETIKITEREKEKGTPENRKDKLRSKIVKKKEGKIVKKYIINLQESKHLLDIMKKTIEINNYDYKKMIKDFEANERFQNNYKRLKKKWEEENKKYQTSIEHMKEFTEQTYLKKNSDLMNKLNKKETLWITGLENQKIDKLKEKERLIEQMMKKEKIAKKNVEKFMELQEKLRLDFEKETNLKCNSNMHLIIFIFNNIQQKNLSKKMKE